MTVNENTGKALGSGAGKLLYGKIAKAGSALKNSGQDKLLSGYIRKYAGQSHSSLIRQGRKFVEEGTKILNTYQGLSSSTGSFIGGGLGYGYGELKVEFLGW